MRRERLLSLLVFSIHSASPALAKAPAAPPQRAPAERSFADVVPDGASGEGSDADCLEALAARLRGRPGVRRASAEGSEVALEIQPGAFKPDLVQNEDIPRCNQTPSRFARPVPKGQGALRRDDAGALGGRRGARGERWLEELLMWKASSAFSTCEPFVEGRLPKHKEKPQ